MRYQPEKLENVSMGVWQELSSVGMTQSDSLCQTLGKLACACSSSWTQSSLFWHPTETQATLYPTQKQAHNEDPFYTLDPLYTFFLYFKRVTEPLCQGQQPGRQWPEVSDFVSRFCTLSESENTRTCENCTRKILGPLPSARLPAAYLVKGVSWTQILLC